LAGLCKRSTCANHIISVERSIFGSVFTRIEDSENALAIDNQTGGAIEEEDSTSWIFVNEWLAAIADAVAGIIVLEIGKISAFSLHGKAQLIVDIDYIR
jgi:hypothetical protein